VSESGAYNYRVTAKFDNGRSVEIDNFLRLTHDETFLVIAAFCVLRNYFVVATNLRRYAVVKRDDEQDKRWTEHA